MPKLLKPIFLVPFLISGLSVGSISAYGAAIENYLSAGLVTFEDDSNEFIVRQDTCNNAAGCSDLLGNNYNLGETYYRPLTGSPAGGGDTVQQGDLIVQLYDIPIIVAGGNSQQLPVDAVEVTGVAVSKFAQVSPTADRTTSGPDGLFSYSAQNTVNEAATAAEWEALTGIDISSVDVGDGPMDLSASGLIALVYFDANDNLEISTDAYPDAVDNITDGSLELALGISDPSDFVTVTGAPENICTYLGCDGAITPGVTNFGFFNYQLSVLLEGLGGSIDPKVVFGSGNSLASNNDVSSSIDDTQFTFNYVPEPGSVLLMGLGLLGLSFFRKRVAV